VSGKDPSRGIVEYRYTLLNQRDETVFTCRSINLVALRPAPLDLRGQDL
jgi:acyl dehydratase